MTSKRTQRQIAILKERRKNAAIVLKSATRFMDPSADGRIISQVNTLVDRMYNPKSFRYQPKTIVFRAIKNGYSTRSAIEGETLISGGLLDECLRKLTLSGKICLEEFLYVERLP